MIAEEPIDLRIMLKIVEYISTRAGATVDLGQVEAAQITHIVNHLAGGSSIGTLIDGNISTTREISVGDEFTTGQAGAVGPGSVAAGQQFAQIWIQNAGEISLGDLVNDLMNMQIALRANTDNPENDVVLSNLARAELAARDGNGTSAMAHLARAGKWALQVARDIGAEVAAKAIQKSLGI
jgi:hypothetical protein